MKKNPRMRTRVVRRLMRGEDGLTEAQAWDIVGVALDATEEDFEKYRKLSK